MGKNKVLLGLGATAALGLTLWWSWSLCLVPVWNIGWAAHGHFKTPSSTLGTLWNAAKWDVGKLTVGWGTGCILAGALASKTKMDMPPYHRLVNLPPGKDNSKAIKNLKKKRQDRMKARANNQPDSIEQKIEENSKNDRKTHSATFSPGLNSLIYALILTLILGVALGLGYYGMGWYRDHLTEKEGNEEEV